MIVMWLGARPARRRSTIARTSNFGILQSASRIGEGAGSMAVHRSHGPKKRRILCTDQCNDSAFC